LLSSRACFRLPVRNEINLQSGNKKVLTFTQQKNCPAKLDHLTRLNCYNTSKMIKIRIVLLSSLLGGLQGFSSAQIHGSDALTNINDLAGGSMFRSFDNRFKGIKGTPALYAIYKKGLIQAASGKWFTNDSINYDAFNDDLLVKHKGLEAIVSKDFVKQFIIIDHDSLKFIKKELPGGEMSFVRMIVNYDIKLFAKESKVISEPRNTGAYSAGRSYSEFEIKKSFFLESKHFGIKEFKTKKDILTNFQSKQAEIDLFIKNNKINVKKEGDLILLVQYLNTH
jgi:hypothetical protein